MSSRTLTSCITLSCSVLLSACVSTPPALTLHAPTHWQEHAQEKSATELQQWWLRFHDQTLNQLVTTALANNLDIKQAQARIKQARAALAASDADLYPDINFDASVTRSDNGNFSTSSSKNRLTTLYRAGFDASWEIDWLGQTRKTINAATARHQAAIEDLRDTQVTLLGDIASQYIALRNSQRQRAIAQENIAAQQEQLQLTQARYQRGLSSYLDVAEAQTQLSTTQAALPTYDAQEKQALRALAVLLGCSPQTMSVTMTNANAVPVIDVNTAIGLPSDLLWRRPDLRAEQQRLSAAADDIGVAQLDRYPSLDLTFGLGLQSATHSNFFSLSNRYWSLVPGLHLPIFDAGKITANIDDKKALYEEARYHYQQSFNLALQDVENALTGFYTENTRSTHLHTSVDAATTAVDLAKQRYASGLDDFLTVIEAQRALYSAQSNWADAEANRSLQAIALYKSLGGGWQ